MKNRLKTAVLIGVLMGTGLHGATAAAASSVKKAEKPAVKKQGTVSASKKTPVLAKGTSQKIAKKPDVKAKGSKSTVAQAPVARHGSKAQKSHLAASHATNKNIRRVSLNDVDGDPARLALYSASALVIDQTTGQPLVEKQPEVVTPIASISKLMTAMVVLDAKQDLQEIVTISEEDIDGLKGTRSRLPVGTTMTRETAMLLALMSSENRAANALGRHYPGGLPAFVQAMNRKAHALGMINSHFLEPTGLSSNNVSTAYDLARMVAAAARYPDIRRFSTTAEARVELNGHIRDFHNTNALVRSDNWEIGVSKTGYISEAGRCLVMQARVADKPVVIVLLDSNGKMTRVGDAQRIKRWMESAGLSVGRKPA